MQIYKKIWVVFLFGSQAFFSDCFSTAITDSIDSLTTLQQQLTTLLQNLTSLKQELTTLKTTIKLLQIPPITSLDDLAEKIEATYTITKNPRSILLTNAYVSTIDDLQFSIGAMEDTLFTKAFPHLQLYNPKELVRSLLNEAVLSTFTCMGDLGTRILLILQILNDSIYKFGSQKAELFTHVEYGEGAGGGGDPRGITGCLQTYLMAYALLKIGFTNIQLHLVSLEILSNQARIIQESLSTSNALATIKATFFTRNDYLGCSNQKMFWKTTPTYLSKPSHFNSIGNGSYSMVFPVWTSNIKFPGKPPHMPYDFVAAIVQSCNNCNNSDSLQDALPLVYILLADKEWKNARYELINTSLCGESLEKSWLSGTYSIYLDPSMQPKN